VSTGKRVCLGEEMGRMLIFAFASTAIFNFKISLAADEDVESVLEGDCGITLNPKAHRLTFKPHL
jgi:ecdysteroid 25-hydroxylase